MSFPIAGFDYLKYPIPIIIESSHGTTYTSDPTDNSASEIMMDNPLIGYGYKPRWWTYTPTIASPNVMTVTTAASTYGTTLAVFTGNPSPTGLTLIKQVSTPLVEPQPPAHMDVQITAGTTYYIGIFSHADYVDSYQLTLTGPNTNTFPFSFRVPKNNTTPEHWAQIRTDVAGPLRLRQPDHTWHYQCASTLPGARPLSFSQDGIGWEVVAWFSPFNQQVINIDPQWLPAVWTVEQKFWPTSGFGTNVLSGDTDALSPLYDGSDSDFDDRYAHPCFAGARVEVHARAGKRSNFVTFVAPRLFDWDQIHYDVDFDSMAEVLVYFYADAGGHASNLISIERAAQVHPALAIPDASGDYGPLVGNPGAGTQYNLGYTPTPFSGVATAPSGAQSCRIRLHHTILAPLPTAPLLTDFYDTSQAGNVVWWAQDIDMYIDSADIQPG